MLEWCFTAFALKSAKQWGESGFRNSTLPMWKIPGDMTSGRRGCSFLAARMEVKLQKEAAKVSAPPFPLFYEKSVNWWEHSVQWSIALKRSAKNAVNFNLRDVSVSSVVHNRHVTLALGSKADVSSVKMAWEVCIKAHDLGCRVHAPDLALCGCLYTLSKTNRAITICWKSAATCVQSFVYSSGQQQWIIGQGYLFV